MAQSRLRNYKHDILSFEHNIFNLGMHNPGRYCGFDTLTVPDPTGAQLTGTIGHGATGITYKNPVNVVTGPLGVILTPQGDIIMEDDDIGPFTFDTNLGNAEIRYDLLVFNHNHIVSVGGEAGTYSIIRGTFSSAVKPVLTDPLKQTAIGIFEFPADASQLNQVEYIKIKCPDSGDGEDARLLEPNAFRAIQLQRESPDTYVPSAVSFAGLTFTRLYTLLNNGNVFNISVSSDGAQTVDGLRVKNVTMQEGARIYLKITNRCIIRQNSSFLPVYGPKGYRPFALNPGMGNIPYAGSNGVAIQPTPGETWELECVFSNDVWYIAKIGGVGTNSAFKRGMQIMWYGDVNAAFNSDGSGINIMTGWQVCNGLNNAPDVRGQLFGMGVAGVPSVGAPDLSLADPDSYLNSPLFEKVGRKRTIITQGNLPNYTLTAPPHFHYTMGDGVADDTPDNTIHQFPERPVNWTSNRHHGNQDYDAVAPNNPNLTATVGRSSSVTLSIPSGGANAPFEFLPPAYMGLLIQKM